MNLKNVLTSMFLAGVLVGCKTSGPIVDYEERGSVYTGVNWRAAYTPTYYDVKLKESKSVPVHPDDSGFLTGSTDVKAKSGVDLAAFSLGLEGLVGTKDTQFFTGLDFQFDFSSLIESHKLWLYDFRQQKSDPRPADNGSFAYDKIDPGIVTPIPLIGVRTRFENLILSAELGFPYKTFTREWGHHRFNREQKIGSESDSKWGLRPSLGIGYKIDKNSSIGLEAAYESYNLKFGKIEGTTLMLMYKINF